MTTTRKAWIAAAAALAAAALGPAARADTDYAIADGAAEIGISVDPDETMLWLNTFPVDPAGAYIDTIRTAYGRVGGPSTLNGLAVRILLYEDANGGSPQDAVLKWSFTTTIANANTNTLNVYRVPEVKIEGTLVVAVSFDNSLGTTPKGVAAFDTTAPTLAARSYLGFAGGSVDASSLTVFPASQWGTIESFGQNGNFRIEAHGRAAVDDAAVSLTVGQSSPPGLVSLSWAGAQAAYDVWRASRPDFSDGRLIAAATPATSLDDNVLGDGRAWFYRVR